MADSPNWGNLVAKNRAKAVGVPWSDAELEAIHNHGVNPDYVRRGALTQEEYDAMKAKDDGVKDTTGEAPLASLRKADLQKIASDLGISFTDVVGKNDLIALIETERAKSGAGGDNGNDHA